MSGASEGKLEVAQVFRDHAPFAWRVLRRLGVPERDVEDVCQEVFLVVARKLEEFEGRSSVRTWVYGICVRVASDYRKSARVRREEISPVAGEGPDSDKQLDVVALRQARATLDRILDTLDDDKRAVFVLYEIEQVKMPEIALALGCPLQTAYSRLHAARARVQEAIAAERGRDRSSGAAAGAEQGGAP